MRTVRTVLAALVAAVVVALPVALAGPAAAGGPTSALLSVPGEGRTASLYYTDAAYDELSRLLGVASTGGTADDGRDHSSVRSVTVTWLIHDVQPWRIDRIYLGGPGGPWVQTQVGLEGSIWDAPTGWSRPAEPKALLALLQRLGLEPGGAPVDGALPQPVVTPAPQSLGARRAATTTGAGQSSSTAAQEPGTPWLPVSVAFLAGLAVAAGAGMLVARRNTGRSADVVLDVEADPQAGPENDWSPAEELAHHR